MLKQAVQKGHVSVATELIGAEPRMCQICLKFDCDGFNSLMGAAWGCGAVGRTGLAGVYSSHAINRTAALGSLLGLGMSGCFLRPGCEVELKLQFLIGTGSQHEAFFNK